MIYGFDTASTLAEETRDPRRAAPKAVLFSIIGAFIIGGVFLLGTLMAIPNMHTAITGNGGWAGPANIIEANFSSDFATHLPAGGVGRDLRLLPVDHGGDHPALLRHVARQPAAVLQARSPGSRRGLHTPVWTCIAIAIVAAIPFLQYTGAGIIAIAATAMIYLAYFLGNLAILRARLRGWPRPTPRSSCAAGAWRSTSWAWSTAARCSSTSPGRGCRATRRRTRGSACSTSTWGWLNGIPILWTVLVFLLLVGDHLLPGHRADARSSPR